MISPVCSLYRSVRRTSDTSTLVSIRAYGRAFIARSCARRSFAAETIFMAFVICRVFFTLRMRRRRSSTFAIVYLAAAVSCWLASFFSFRSARNDALNSFTASVSRFLRSSSSAFLVAMSVRIAGAALSRYG